MKKQMLRARTILGLVAMMIGVGAAGPAAAQTFEQIRVDVPFEFTDGRSVFPAGKYTIRPIAGAAKAGISITSEDGDASVFHLCFNAEVTMPKNQTSLVFNRYGDAYFLSQVWTAGETIGLQLPQSSRERRLGRGLPTGDGQSGAASGPAIVTIAATVPTAR
jgi:hypothetical protein